MAARGCRLTGAKASGKGMLPVVEEPGGRSLQDSALQGDRRAPSTLAADDDPPMNPHETHVL
jgi:hypothetical protein